MNDKREFIITINQKFFTITQDGGLAIDTEGKVYPLEDKQKESRFK